MSRLSELQRKAALVRAYLESIDDYPSSTRDQIRLLKMTRAGFDKWIEAETLKPRLVEQASEALKKQTNNSHDPRNLFDDAVGVMELGYLLGLTRTECQMSIDKIAGELGPTFNGFSMSGTRADTTLSLFGGLYVIYRLEQTRQAAEYSGREKSVMCMALSVRYRLPGNKVQTRNLYRVRTRLMVPAYRLPFDYHEYDGYATAPDSSGRHYWLFETRKEAEQDMIFMMTNPVQHGALKLKGRKIALGVMLSRTQDETSVPAIWPIVIERYGDFSESDVDEAFENSNENQFVREMARLEDPANIEPWVFDKLEEAARFALLMYP